MLPPLRTLLGLATLVVGASLLTGCTIRTSPGPQPLYVVGHHHAAPARVVYTDRAPARRPAAAYRTPATAAPRATPPRARGNTPNRVTPNRVTPNRVTPTDRRRPGKARHPKAKPPYERPQALPTRADRAKKKTRRRGERRR